MKPGVATATRMLFVLPHSVTCVPPDFPDSPTLAFRLLSLIASLTSGLTFASLRLLPSPFWALHCGLTLRSITFSLHDDPHLPIFLSLLSLSLNSPVSPVLVKRVGPLASCPPHRHTGAAHLLPDPTASDFFIILFFTLFADPRPNCSNPMP